MLVGSAFRGQMGKPLPCAWVLKYSLTLAYSHAYMSSGFHGQIQTHNFPASLCGSSSCLPHPRLYPLRDVVEWLYSE